MSATIGSIGPTAIMREVAGVARMSDTREASRRLERMFRTHHALIWRTLRRLGWNPEAAADATQQAFLVAAKRLEDIRPGAERAFLFSTALRMAHAMFRREKRHQLTDDMDTHIDLQHREDQTLERQYALQLVDKVFAHMDDDLVTVFTLFELEEMSAPEIAQVVGIPVGTVASRLRRARKAFRTATARIEQNIVKREMKA